MQDLVARTTDTADHRVVIVTLTSKGLKTFKQAMKKLMKNRTSFVIAHRLSTIQDAQNILVMDKGSIIEQGTHAQIMSKQGFYYELFISQFSSSSAA